MSIRALLIRRFSLVTGVVFSTALMMPLKSAVSAQQAPPGQQQPAAKPQAPVERLGPNLLRIGEVQIDTAKREVSVRGTVNEVTIVEYFANTKGGLKGYESALELETNAINFNLALILIGMDNTRSVVPRFKFDPEAPQGDPLEIWVEWNDGGVQRKVPAEQLLYNRQTNLTVSEGPWVYTGSVFSSTDNAFFAEIEGTLIGFMHTPSPLIENPRPIVGPYGAVIINPALKLKPKTPVVVTVRALARGK